MSRQISVTVHEIAVDGLPDMDNLIGRVAFIFDGCIVSGWPLDRYARARIRRELGDEPGDWEANSDVGRHGAFGDVTHWVEFPTTVGSLAASTEEPNHGNV